MESALSVWRRRADETWIAGVAPAALRKFVRSLHDELGRAPRSERLLVATADPLELITCFIAALTNPRPVDLFLGSARWTPAERDAAAAALHRGENERGDRSRIMIPTGGTSGGGVRFATHTWETLAAAAFGLQAWLGGGPIDSVCFLPLHHVSGLMQVVRSFATDGVLTLANWDAIERGKFPRVARPGAVTSLVPTQLVRLLEVTGGVEWLRSFHAVFLGGAPAWPQLLERARAEGIPLAPCYGMTETAAQVTTLRPAEFLAGANGAGRALPHAQIDIVDGRVRVRSTSLFCGYHPDAGLPRAEFFTNDRGVLSADGMLTVLGRADALINSGGEKIDPAEVEAAVRATGLVRDVAVAGVPDAEWGEAVVALIVGNAESPVEKLREKLRTILAPHKMPKRFIEVAVLPRNEAGKIDRSTLAEIAMRSSSS